MRAVHLFGQACYERLATSSVSHLDNLRANAPEGGPGFIRIDTVDQGDHDGIKVLYHINAVDIVTQWQLVASCEEDQRKLLAAHDRRAPGRLALHRPRLSLRGGGECINHEVAKLLEKLRVEFTRRLPRHINDNALVESKNGSVIRKQFGYPPIAQHFASDMERPLPRLPQPLR